MGLTRAAGLPSPPLRLAPASGREEEAASRLAQQHPRSRRAELPAAGAGLVPHALAHILRGAAAGSYRRRAASRPPRRAVGPPCSASLLPSARRLPGLGPRFGLPSLRGTPAEGRPVARVVGVGHFVASPGFGLREAAGVNSLLSGLAKVFPECWQ